MFSGCKKAIHKNGKKKKKTWTCKGVSYDILHNIKKGDDFYIKIAGWFCE